MQYHTIQDVFLQHKMNLSMSFVSSFNLKNIKIRHELRKSNTQNSNIYFWAFFFGDVLGPMFLFHVLHLEVKKYARGTRTEQQTMLQSCVVVLIKSIWKYMLHSHWLNLIFQLTETLTYGKSLKHFKLFFLQTYRHTGIQLRTIASVD